MEGLNGQLPNLDLFNLVQKLTNKEGIACGYKQAKGKRPKASHVNNIWQMLTMVLSQSTGVPTGNHGLFHRFGIEAVTLEGVTRSDAKSSQSLLPMLRILEGISRSLNNLLERFHQSFFFYLIVANDRFVSIGDYMPCIALMAGSLLIKSFIMWLSLHQTDAEATEETDKVKEENVESPNLMRIGLLVIFAHGAGFLINYLPFYNSVNDFFCRQALSTEVTLTTLLITVSVLALFSSFFFRFNREDVRVRTNKALTH